MKYNWFHGDIDKNRSEILLRQAKKNSYLVRFSYTSTSSPFTLSKITSGGIYFGERRARYYRIKERLRG
jgi:hypothetical protein